MTIEEYLKKELSEGKIDFKLRASYYHGFLKFYIHPEGKDGLTGDFLFIDGELKDQLNVVFSHSDTSENFHPYECDGLGKCIHCDRKKTDTHNPETCALCQS